VGTEKSLEGQFLLRVGLDTMLNCVELTKEMIQREALYTYSMIQTPMWSPKWDKGRQGIGEANEKTSILNRRLHKGNDVEREAYDNWQ